MNNTDKISMQQAAKDNDPCYNPDLLETTIVNRML